MKCASVSLAPVRCTRRRKLQSSPGSTRATKSLWISSRSGWFSRQSNEWTRHYEAKCRDQINLPGSFRATAGGSDRQLCMTLPRCVLPNTTYLVTRRCIGRRFLLRPDPSINKVFTYCLARAVEKFGVDLHAACVMSNHYHLVMTDVRGVLPDFTAWLNRQLAMCIKCLRSWDEVVWEPNVPCSAVELSGPSEVLDKVVYVLLNPVSAELVPSPERWPGVVTTMQTLRAGERSVERPRVWFRTRAPATGVLRVALPNHFPDAEQYFDALERLVFTRLQQVKNRMRRKRRPFLGLAGIRKTVFSQRPAKPKQRFGSNPTFSALTRTRWLAAVRKLRAFRSAYREAYEAWRSGSRETSFPVGTWWMVERVGAPVAP
jgi:putative transposase